MNSKYYPLFFAFLAFSLQLLFTLNSTNQIRLEEIDDSIRSPYLLSESKLYDGVYSNIGWYSPLLLIYKTFGFHLFIAKYFRLFLTFFSFYFFSKLLLKYFKKNALVPILTIFLSPTLLYFSSLMTINGLILQYLPILIYFFDQLNSQKTKKNYLNHFLFFSLSMICWMTYSLFVIYLPIFLFLYIKKIKPKKNPKLYFLSTLSFLSPFLLIFQLKNKKQLFFDPKVGKGLFRGAGEFNFSLPTISNNFNGLLKDFFITGDSYLFEIKHPEFSLIFPILTFLLVFYLSFKLLKNKKYKALILASYTLIILNLILSSISFDPSYSPGIRRNTGVLAAFYFLFILVWQHINTKKIKYQKLFIFFFFLLPFHHLLILPSNLTNIQKESKYIANPWFNFSSTPQKHLDNYLTILKKQNFNLSCQNKLGNNQECRYTEIYSTLSASCKFNYLNCKNIYGFSNLNNQFIILDTNLWQQ